MPKPNETDLEAMLSADPTEDEEETNEPETEDETGEGDESEETLLDEDESGSEDEDESGEDGEEGGKKSKKGQPSAAEKRIEALERTISRLHGEVKKLTKPAEKPKEEEKPVEFDFEITDDDFEKVMASKDKYIAHVKAIAKKSHDKAVETVLRKLPEIIDGIVSGKVAMQSTIDAFWRANKDLVRHRKFVASIFNDVKERYPDLDDGEIIERHLAKAARRELGLNAPNKQPQGGKKPNVALGTKGASRGAQKPLKGIAQEILAMEKL